MMTLKQLVNDEAFLYKRTCISVTYGDTVIADKISHKELQERLNKDLSKYASSTVIMTELHWDMQKLTMKKVIDRVDITIK